MSEPDFPAARYCAIGAHRMAYRDAGQGAPVLMLHGNPSWSYLWRHLIAGLSEAHRCIAPDWIGMGESDKPDDAHYRYTLAARVDELEALYQHLVREQGLPERGWTLAVHDWGGMIGFAWAVRYPERIARLVVLNTAAFPNPKGRALPWTLRLGRDSALGEWLIRGFNAFARGALRWGTVRAPSSCVRQRMLAPYDSWASRRAIARFVQDIPLDARDPAYAIVADTAQGLHRLADRPMLLAWGLRDFVFDAAFYAEFRRRFPQAQAHAYEDAGHYVLEDAHERIVPQVRAFLREHTA